MRSRGAASLDPRGRVFDLLLFSSLWILPAYGPALSFLPAVRASQWKSSSLFNGSFLAGFSYFLFTMLFRIANEQPGRGLIQRRKLFKKSLAKCLHHQRLDVNIKYPIKKEVKALTDKKAKRAAYMRAYRARLKADPEKAAKELHSRKYSSVKSYIKLHASIKEIGEIRQLAAERHKALLAKKKK